MIDDDRHLLFGATALQNGLIGRDRLTEAIREWSVDRTLPLAEHLVARADLTLEDREAVEALVARQLEKRAGDASRCLATLTTLGPLSVGDLTRAPAPPGDEATRVDDDRPLRPGSSGVPGDGRRFRVIRPHAQGGLGAVFVALDAELNREVALKQILDRHADDEVSRTRFLLEAEITGGLEHPGIVPVYGLGASEGGRPYYAMRFIRGDTLKDAIAAFHAESRAEGDPARTSLALRQLLRRFVDVCNAIDYAHGRGVIHRDLKPANVIVGKHGETLVVDWGLAKLAGRAEPGSGEGALVPSSASGSAMTLPGSVMGTPAYMSPEQAAGELDKLDARSDVYSLGATLYCLLTGRAAFVGDALAVLRAVRVGEFPPPRAVDPAIDRPLEAIALKAMATAPEGRYPSARALADDLERWAADEPVTARREGRLDRLGRWARRHRSATRAAAMALMVVALTAAVAAVLIGRERDATLRALDSEAEARRFADGQSRLALDAVRDYYTGVSRDFLLKQPELEGLRKSLLRSPLAFYRRLAASLEAAPGSDRAGRVRLGEAQYDLGRLVAEVDSAAASIPAFEQALGVQEALARERPDSPDDQLRLARTRLDLANKYDGAGRAPLARAALDRVQLDCAAQQARHPEDDRFTALRAEGLQLRADFLWDQGEMAAARADYEESTRLGAALVRAHPDDLAQVDKQASSLNNLQILQKHEGGAEGRSDAALLASIALRESLVKSAPSDPMYRSNLSSCYMNMAAGLLDVGRFEEARGWTEKALAIQRDLIAGSPNVVVFQERLGSTLGNLSTLERGLGRLGPAEAAILEAVEVVKRHARSRPGQVHPLKILADDYANLAAIERGLDKIGAGLEAADLAVARSEDALALEPDRHDVKDVLAYALMTRGDLREHSGRVRDAIDDLGRAEAIGRALVRDVPEIYSYRISLAQSLGGLGATLRLVGRAREAEPRLREAIAIHRVERDRDPRALGVTVRLAATLAELADLLGRDARAPEALALLAESLAILDDWRKVEPDDAEIPRVESLALGRRADLLSRLGRTSEALLDDDRALRVAPPRGRRALALHRALDLARAGDPPAALAAARLEERSAPLESPDLIRLAAVHARCAPAYPASLDRALTLIGEARATPVYREPDRLRVELEDPAFDPIRPRPEFQARVQDLSFPTDPFGPPEPAKAPD